MGQHICKGVVASFAIACAIFVPRILTALGTSDPLDQITLFGEDFLWLSAALSVMIGVAVAMLYANVACEPPKVFTAALAFPAVVASAFNLTSGVGEIEAKTSEVQAISSKLLNQLDVPTVAPIGIEPVSALPPGTGRSRMYATLFIPSAHAADLSAQQQFGPGRLLAERRYFIVLTEAATKEGGEQALQQLRSKAPNATLVKGGDGKYYVLDGLATRTISQSAIRASELKTAMPNRNDLSIRLLPAPAAR